MLRKFRNVRWDDHPKLTSPNGPSPLKNSLPAKVRIGNLNLAYRSRESSEIVVFNDNLRRDADQGSGRSENAKHSGANCWEAKSVIGLLCGRCMQGIASWSVRCDTFAERTSCVCTKKSSSKP